MQRVVVITGAFGVLGSAVARAAKVTGAQLALIDLAPQPPQALVAELGDDVLWLGGVDLTSPDGAKAAVDAIVQRFGRLDALLNIAGGFRWTMLADSSHDDWAFLFRINVQTAANISRAALDSLKASGSGRIVNVGAGAAERAGVGMAAYTAAKAGVHKLTESLAEELKGSGVTVNAVLPSIIDTPQNRADMPDADPKAWVTPAELAAVILFLASEAASGVTGSLVRVPGRV